MDYQRCVRRVHAVGAVLVLCCSFLGGLVATTMLHKVLWATENAIFYNKTAPTLAVQMGDAIDFVCPQLIQKQAGSDKIPDHESVMYDFSIYKVNEDDFRGCKLRKASRFVFRCNRPASTRRFTFHIAEFTPIPGGLEFKCDTDYYFIASTNVIQDKGNTSDMCATYNTKLRMKVSCDDFNNEVTNPTGTDGRMTGKKPVAPHADDSRVTVIVVVCVVVGVIIIVVVVVLLVLILRRRKLARQANTERRGSRQAIDIVRNPDNATLKLAVVDITKPEPESKEEEHLYWTILDETNERVVE